MLEIKGRYNHAKVFTDTIEESAIEQIQTLCDMPYTADLKIRIMPDVHAGAGCTIGTTMEIKDKVVPNLVGVDIGCGMEVVRLAETELDLEKLDQIIHTHIPSGFHIRTQPHAYSEKINLHELKCAPFVKLDRAVKSIGTLGGGNHFIEIDKDDEGQLYLVIHSGSRHLGNEAAHHYQRLGWQRMNHFDPKTIADMIVEYRQSGREQEIQKEIERMKNIQRSDIPASLAYVEEDLFEDYLHDLVIIQQFAMLNRQAIADEIMTAMNLHAADQFTTIHNYIDTETMILRKGAVSAKKGEILLIPINMRDGSLICMGKGNPDWNESAPHGAGRLFSRMSARKQFTLEAFKASMEGIYTTSIQPETLDECPMAYKDMNEIIKNIEPTVELIRIIKPIYNFKAGE